MRAEILYKQSLCCIQTPFKHDSVLTGGLGRSKKLTGRLTARRSRAQSCHSDENLKKVSNCSIKAKPCFLSIEEKKYNNSSLVVLKVRVWDGLTWTLMHGAVQKSYPQW